MRAVTLALISLLLLSLLPASAEEEKVIGKIDIEYAKYIENKLTSIGSYKEPKFLGFRVAGTPEDLETANFIAEEMRKMGLVNVSLEPVPLDAWEFKGARLELSNGKVIIASSFGGVPGTGSEGISGEIVYVGDGTRGNYEGLNVSGKLVLAYWNPDISWLNMIAHEAMIHGAKGVILFNPPNGSYAQHPNALHSFDGLYSSDFIPMIVISKEDAQEIIEMLKSGPVEAKMVNLATLKRGTGWNTIGYIPGRRADEYILIAAHHDAWFYGAMDDTGAVAALLTLAKAIKESGYVPERTLVFMTHTAEEYGIVDAYYDWLIGAWWRITQAHPEWRKKAIAYINLEGMAIKGAPLGVYASPELSTFISEILDESKELLPYGRGELEDVWCWTEAWPYAAAGVPSINLDTFSPWFRQNIYHTQFDSPEIIDWDYLGKIISLTAKILIRLDKSELLPYDFSARAAHLRENLNVTRMKQLGAEPEELMKGVEELEKAFSEFRNLSKNVSSDVIVKVNSKLREAAYIMLSELTALDPWDNTIYPHQQVESDALFLSSALDALKRGDVNEALSMIESVSINWYDSFYSYEVFKRELLHKSPNYERITWGALGHLAPPIDLWKEYNSLREKSMANITNYDAEMRSIENHLKETKALYQERLRDIARALSSASSLIREANSILKSTTTPKTEVREETVTPQEVISLIPAVLISILVIVILLVIYLRRRK
ncbi:MAG: M28 family peptidase [Candidatus Korarchaeum sp.]|nr:M28 family peptidase [Candidatus Korarchaeum sp.]